MNKYSLPAIVVIAAFSACKSNNDTSGVKSPVSILADTSNYTTIQWIDSVQNFGTAKFGDKVNVEYAFKNVGSKPLYITEVRPTCGCTVADYTKSAVMPGDKGFVKAQYDSHHGTTGSVHKSIIVSSNTVNDKHFVLSFTGMVTK
ncbi:hypothetical protein A9P82_05645 [Arachidicoccus ginsenosidimutans]|uniref:DUF1573 domain-containing protein n=1 Tax=Arachidicoccus sp. BS20 TaxID=1850526 RepID=UPI0007F0C8AF|nr:DUF1573 domain-containing protein [Arachidicoccus sp. BS20]ANI88817.1 hypothetical protein A9P82_05645 [Arachidicoccus sp. BS20]